MAVAAFADVWGVLQSSSGAWAVLAFFTYQLYWNTVVPTSLHETKLHAYFRRVEEKEEQNRRQLLAQSQVLTCIASVLPPVKTEKVEEYMEQNGVDPLVDFIDDDMGNVKVQTQPTDD